MRWYKKAAVTGAWEAYVHAESAEEVRQLHDGDLSFIPELAVRYPGPYVVNALPDDFVPPAPLQQLVVGNFEGIFEGFSLAEAVAPENWQPVETTLTTPTLKATLRPDGTLYLSGPALQEGVAGDDVQALTRFLNEHVPLPLRPSPEEIDAEMEALFRPQRVDSYDGDENQEET